MVTMRWIGTFSPGEIQAGGETFVDVQAGSTISVSPAIALGMMAGDGSWWRVQSGGAGMLAGSVLGTPGARA